MTTRMVLQSPITISTSTASQDPLAAIDVGDWDELSVIVNLISTGAVSAGYLKLQTAVDPFEQLFVDFGSIATVPLNACGATQVYVKGHARYLRWNTESYASGAPTFSMDVFCKCRG